MVREPLERLLAADSHQAVTDAARTLVTAAETSHQQAFVDTLTVACQAAAVRVGLDKVEVSTAGNGTLRVIASNDLGRALVTEITTSADGHVAMESEVIGGDGRCTEIMDTFDRALDAEGVVTDQPTRRSTGGVCDLAAAKAFVTRQYRSRAQRDASHSSGTEQSAGRTRGRGTPQEKARTRR